MKPKPQETNFPLSGKTVNETRFANKIQIQKSKLKLKASEDMNINLVNKREY